MNHHYLAIRRVTDRAFAAALIVIASPVLAGVALSVRLTMGTPVFFRQDRVGENGRVFRITKFRTMVRGAEQLGGGYMPTELDLIPRCGRFLRSTSLDELPQLFNIITGDMSFIGPRPALPSQFQRYSDRQRRRVEVPQGVTGYAQVRYRNAAPWSKRIDADLVYVDRLSFRLDIRILFETVRSVISRKGIEQHQTADEVDDLPPAPDPERGEDSRAG